MTAPIQWTIKAKNTLKRLNISIKEDLNLYRKISTEFIMRNEIYWDNGYANISRFGTATCDIRGNITVGIGFNMDAKGARMEWIKAFDNKIDFDDVYNATRILTQEEIELLFKHNLMIREMELKGQYANSWNKLKPNEKLAITDSYYNAPRTVYSGSFFAKLIKHYTETGNPEHLSVAAMELKKSHDFSIEGIKKRREIEAIMLY